MLTDEQKTQLAQPLDPQLVKQRKQGGRQVDYIEGHTAQRHCNEIFGFDGWSMEVAMLQEVFLGDHKNQRKAGYIAKVRLTVGDVVREDVGAGSGYGADDCDAVESAIKEAVTDAMKRALKGFGDQFGLGLYGGGNAHQRQQQSQQQQQEQQEQQEQQPTFREWFDGQIKFYTEVLGKDGMDAVLKQQGIGDLAAIKTRGEATNLIKALTSAVDKQNA